jgi:hypothetical protein
MRKYLAFLTVLGFSPAVVAEEIAHRCATESLPFEKGYDARTPRANLVPKRRTIFLNRQGGTYIQGTENDSRMNWSTIVDGPSTLSASQFSDDDWAVVFDCVKGTFAPFAVEITDVEPPTTTTYIESVVAGTATELVRDTPSDGFLGVAPRTCEPLDRCVNFSLARDHCGQSPCSMDSLLMLCWTVVQETSHCLGLEHEYLCADPMTYLGGPCALPKRFQDSDTACGEFDGPRTCLCSSTNQQNSVQHLLSALGPYEENPPTISISEPADGAVVPPRFAVVAAASDDVRIDRVELFDGDTFVTTDDMSIYQFTAALSLGAHTVRVRAVDGNENEAFAMVNVTVEAECGDSVGACESGRECVEGTCLAGLGTNCDNEAECASGLCYVDTAAQTSICSQECRLDDSGSCPGGFTCTEVQFGNPKCLKGGEAGCGCVVGGRASGVATGSLLALGLLVALQRRRGRRA